MKIKNLSKLYFSHIDEKLRQLEAENKILLQVLEIHDRQLKKVNNENELIKLSKSTLKQQKIMN